MRKFFNERAGSWDKTATYEPEKIRVMLQLSDIAPSSQILDIGCGSGVLEPYLLEYNPRKILAVDFAENMIRVAREKLRHPAVEFACLDIFELTGLAFDTCFIYNAFPHFPNPSALVAHAASLLRGGGRLTISHPQGKKALGAEIRRGYQLFATPLLPAQGLVNLLTEQFRVDVMVDNNAMYMVSAVRL